MIATMCFYGRTDCSLMMYFMSMRYIFMIAKFLWMKLLLTENTFHVNEVLHMNFFPTITRFFLLTKH
jgi:hypothetical protein